MHEDKSSQLAMCKSNQTNEDDDNGAAISQPDQPGEQAPTSDVSEHEFETSVSCPNCEATFSNEEQLRNHVYDCNPDLLPEDEDDCTILEEDSPEKANVNKKLSNKEKNLKCRHCSFKAKNKLEFWEHGTIHIRPEKMLTCPKCSFVTEYKHHLEYHLRNHFGSKPFKCDKCSYSCVNKSMLNSHMKSHSSVYQYRCLDCSYATKYCHSLKLHLRKYTHKPAIVLNPDGTPNPLPIIDIYGTRRGPRPKKQKPEIQLNDKISEQSTNHFGSVLANRPLLPPHSNSPFYFPPPIYGNLAAPLTGLPSLGLLGNPIKPIDVLDKAASGNGSIRCNNCDFHTFDREEFSKHMVQHIAKERQEESDRSRHNSQSDEPQSPSSPINPPRFTPLDLTVTNEMMDKQNSSPSINFRNTGLPDFNDMVQQSRDNYANSLGGTTDLETSSISSMSPDDVARSLQKSPPPLHPLNDAILGLIARRRANVDQVLRSHPYFSEKLLKKKQWKEVHTCTYCDMAFENYSMYTVHMGYHGYANPFKCNICGHQSEDKVSFFLHIARIAHL